MKIKIGSTVIIDGQAMMRNPGKLDAVRNISILTPNGSYPLGDSHVNWTDGLIFNEDDHTKNTVKSIIKKGGSVVQIGQKFYPVLNMQEMTNSKQWSFVLDYDEHKEIPRRAVKEVLLNLQSN